jgi:hypothetical protein
MSNHYWVVTVLFHFNSNNDNYVLNSLHSVSNVLAITGINHSTDIMAVFKASHKSELIRVIMRVIYPLRNSILNMTFTRIEFGAFNNPSLKNADIETRELLFA